MKNYCKKLEINLLMMNIKKFNIRKINCYWNKKYIKIN